MVKVAVRRLLSSLPIVLIVSFLVFLMISLSPGDPAVRLAGDNPTPALVASIRDRLELNDPLFERYARWLGRALQGNLGDSFANGHSVASLIWQRLPVTLSLGCVALVFSLVLGVGLGTLGALKPASWLDRLVTVICSAAIAVPPFWLALVLVLSLSVERQWFPAIGYSPLTSGAGAWFDHLVIPSLALSAFAAAELGLQLKASLTRTLERDFILACRAKGLTGRQIVFKHALKNAAVPVVTVLGIRATYLFGGTVVIETVFAMNGLGQLTFQSAQTHDVPLLVGLIVLFTVFAAVANLLVDISYYYFNPKVRGS